MVFSIEKIGRIDNAKYSLIMSAVVRWKFNLDRRITVNVNYPNYIDGKLEPWDTHHETFKSANPAYPDITIALFPESTEDDVARAVSAARKAFLPWKSLGPVKRSEYLWRLAKLIEKKKDLLAHT